MWHEEACYIIKGLIQQGKTTIVSISALVTGTQIKALLGTFHIGAGSSPGWCFWSNLLKMPWEKSTGWPRVWALMTHTGDPECLQRKCYSLPQTGCCSYLGIEGHMEDCSLPLSFPPSSPLSSSLTVFFVLTLWKSHPTLSPAPLYLPIPSLSNFAFQIKM